MDQQQEHSDDAPHGNDAATLDPPGTIAVIGAGPLGIEAALYGRYLGYNVTLFEAMAPAASLRNAGEADIPVMPGRCASPLAHSAIDAQAAALTDSDEASGSPKTQSLKTLPTTVTEWIDHVWEPLLKTDLLRGRLRCPVKVERIEYADAEPDSEGEGSDGESIPPDFRLRFQDPETQQRSTDEFEAVIIAVGPGKSRLHAFDDSAEYLFQIGQMTTGDAEQDLWSGLKQIVAIYAELAGRADLDLYRPIRG